MDLDDMEDFKVFRDGLRREEIPTFPRFPFLRKVTRIISRWNGVKLQTRFGQSSTFNQGLLRQTQRIYSHPDTPYYLGDKAENGTRLLIGKVGPDEYFVLAPTTPRNTTWESMDCRDCGTTENVGETGLCDICEEDE